MKTHFIAEVEVAFQNEREMRTFQIGVLDTHEGALALAEKGVESIKHQAEELDLMIESGPYSNVVEIETAMPDLQTTCLSED